MKPLQLEKHQLLALLLQLTMVPSNRKCKCTLQLRDRRFLHVCIDNSLCIPNRKSQQGSAYRNALRCNRVRMHSVLSQHRMRSRGHIDKYLHSPHPTSLQDILVFENSFVSLVELLCNFFQQAGMKYANLTFAAIRASIIIQTFAFIWSNARTVLTIWFTNGVTFAIAMLFVPFATRWDRTSLFDSLHVQKNNNGELELFL
jgi:hypothetical protein